MMTSGQGKGSFPGVARSPSFRQSISFHSAILKESQHLLSKAASSDNSKGDKANGASKPGDHLVKPNQMDDATAGFKAQNHANQHSVARSEKLKTHGNGGILKSDSSRVSRDTFSSAAKTPGLEENFDPQRKPKGTPPKPLVGGGEKSTSLKVNLDPHRKINEVSPKSGMGGEKSTSSEVNTDRHRKAKEAAPKFSIGTMKSGSLSVNADPHKKSKEISPKSTMGCEKSTSGKGHANLCTECKAALEGAVCFIGNDGRVSACTSRTAVRLCKNVRCANNSPEYLASLAAAAAGPKKYLMSRRHSFNARSALTSSKTGKAPVKTQMESQKKNYSTRALVTKPCFNGDECANFDMQGELEDDVVSLGCARSPSELAELDSIGSSSSSHSADKINARRCGYQRMRTRSFSVIEKQSPEVVTLKKQMMQERKQAEEWMLDYAIEEALQRVAPAGESKVKALVEAFESIIPHKGTETPDQVEGPRTPEKSCTPYN